MSSSTPPAQGGIQILGRAEAVVDVSVIMQPQFPQSFVENMEVPQTQFFDRVVVQLLHRDRYTVQTVQKSVEFAQVQTLVLLGHPLLYNDRWCSDKVYATWTSQESHHTKILGDLIKNTVYWCNLKLAQKKGLQFYQTRSHAIVLYNTLPAICIEKAGGGDEHSINGAVSEWC